MNLDFGKRILVFNFKRMGVLEILLTILLSTCSKVLLRCQIISSSHFIIRKNFTGDLRVSRNKTICLPLTTSNSNNHIYNPVEMVSFDPRDKKEKMVPPRLESFLVKRFEYLSWFSTLTPCHTFILLLTCVDFTYEFI